MATKELQATRPPNPHRLSMTSTGTSHPPSRVANPRSHSHSLSVGSINPTHRVTRRKSTNASSIHNVSAVQAALNDMKNGGSTTVFDSNAQNHRRSVPEFVTLDAQEKLAGQEQSGNMAHTENAIIEGNSPPHSSPPNSAKPRARRASEGSYLVKGEGGRRPSGELRCETCGKGYKHSSCLTKHLWEHDPAWAVTSKLLISKHQQVQLLEAASVLVTMNTDGPEAEQQLLAEADDFSASPAPSGSSDTHEDEDSVYSSAETTPPPMSDHYGMPEGISTGRTKRSSGMSSLYSRSYQSAPSSSLPTSNGFSQFSSPIGYTSGISGDEEKSLAAAIETLCSFGTPRSGPAYLPADVPPVPPLPPQYQSHKSGNLFPQPDFGLPSPSYQPLSNERDSSHNKHSSVSEHVRPLSKEHNVDEDGVFGGMEGITHDLQQDPKFTLGSH